jgi:hypothetical protein
MQTCDAGNAYIDAAFALHDDSKSYTGVVIMLDTSVIYVGLQKQKCVTKSPMKVELVGWLFYFTNL